MNRNERYKWAVLIVAAHLFVACITIIKVKDSSEVIVNDGTKETPVTDFRLFNDNKINNKDTIK